MRILPTVRVKLKGTNTEMVVNRKDFDEETMSEVKEKVTDKIKVKMTASGEERDIDPSDFDKKTMVQVKE